MLIIEGSDCLGKTTFAKLLLEEANRRELFPTYYSHMSRPNKTFNFFSHYKDMMSIFAVQDRFHLGGIVWHQAIEQPALDIIEGWLRSIGSMTLIIYASNEEWYKDRLENDDRGNLLSPSSMFAANTEYKMFVQRDHSKVPQFDFMWDVNHGSDKVIYPGEGFAKHIISYWFERLNLLETL